LSARTHPLPRSVTLWYGLGALPGGVAATAGVLLVFFYNQVLGVPGSQVGLVLFAIAVFDAVSDPVVGVLSDGTRSRFGRRHPYLIGAALPLSVTILMVWIPPEGLDSGGLVAWLLGSLVLNRLFDTLVGVPYLALGAELTKDYVERTRLTTVRAVLWNVGRALSGGILLLVFLRPTPEYPNGQMNPAGYTPFAWLAASATLLALWACAWGTRGTIPGLAAPGRRPSRRGPLVTVFTEMRQALAMRDFRAVFGASVALQIAWGISDALGLYMATFFWHVGTQGMVVWGVGMFAGLFTGFPLWRRLAERHDKKPLLIAGASVYLVFFAGPYLLKVAGQFPADAELSFALYVFTTGFVAHIGIAAHGILHGSMLGDVTDVDELACGRRREGVIFAAETFGYKALRGLGALSAGLIVDAAGITPGMTPETVDPSVAAKLGLAQGLSMGLLVAAALFFIRGYGIDRARHERVRTELDARTHSR